MTTTATRTPTSVRPVFEALLLPIGPAAIAVLRYVLPYDTTDDTTAMTARAMAEQGRMSAVLWLGLLAILTLVPATYVVGRFTKPGAPRLTVIAMLLLVPGYLALSWLAAADQFVWSGAQAGLDVDTVVRLSESMHPTNDVAAGVYVLGHVVGTILLGVAMWRARVVAKWAAVAVIVSQPIHFVSAVIVPNHTLDLFGWGLQAAGFAAVSWALLRLRDGA
ncbi:hypothetical protein GCM10009789_33080 [Kribbella sancticallisti]|uniref:DUF4386 family protein n=1 Tax=Kribbella sancticallisti TaxID=460087 RepID=A0ABP4PAG3_9ACTN